MWYWSYEVPKIWVLLNNKGWLGWHYYCWGETNKQQKEDNMQLRNLPASQVTADTPRHAIGRSNRYWHPIGWLLPLLVPTIVNVVWHWRNKKPGYTCKILIEETWNLFLPEHIYSVRTFHRIMNEFLCCWKKRIYFNFHYLLLIS